MNTGNDSGFAKTRTLTLAGCMKIMAAAEAEARKNDAMVSIAILDAGGHLLHFSRMDEAHAGTVDIAIGKARCAAMFRRPTKAFAERYAAGATAVASLPNVFPFEGGVPILIGRECIGAVGASGAAAAVDGMVALAGVVALQE